MKLDISAVTNNQGRVMQEAILDLMLEAEASTVILCNRNGHVLSHTSWSGEANVDSVAALSIGSFAATQELARLTGENEFTAVAHEGANSSVYIHAVQRDFLLVVQFGKSTTLGLVKLYAQKTAQKLDNMLSALADQAPGSTQTRLQFEMDDKSPVFKLPATAES